MSQRLEDLDGRHPLVRALRLAELDEEDGGRARGAPEHLAGGRACLRNKINKLLLSSLLLGNWMRRARGAPEQLRGGGVRECSRARRQAGEEKQRNATGLHAQHKVRYRRGAARVAPF